MACRSLETEKIPLDIMPPDGMPRYDKMLPDVDVEQVYASLPDSLFTFYKYYIFLNSKFHSGVETRRSECHAWGGITLSGGYYVQRALCLGFV